MSSGVVVGYDGSDSAKAALLVAVDVARAHGDELVIAFAYELNPVAGELHDYHAAVKELAEKRLAEALSVVSADDGLEGEAIPVARAPAEALVALADERDARLIVVGTQGESPIRSALLGSTPHKLLHISDRPVLVVPPPGPR